jgi:hypothetical protein
VTSTAWNVQPEYVAFWVLRTGRPAGNWRLTATPLGDADVPVFTAHDASGRTVDSVLFQMRPSRNDG